MDTNRQGSTATDARTDSERVSVVAPTPAADDRMRESTVDIHAWSVERIFNDFPTAAAEASAVLAVAVATGDVAIEAQARLVLATAQTYLEQHQSSDAHFRIAGQRFAELGDARGELLVHGRHAVTLLFLGDAEAAELQLQRGLVEARRLGDRHIMVEYLSNLAALTGNAQRYEESLGYQVECRALAKRERWTFAQLMADGNLAVSYIGLHDYESAALMCREALDLIGDDERYATLRVYFVHHLAVTEEHTGQTAAAILRFTEAADMAALRHDSRSEGQARLNEARLRRTAGDMDGALAAYHRAAEISDDLHAGPADPHNEVPVMARWGIEALSGTWTWDTVSAISALLNQGRPLA